MNTAHAQSEQYGPALESQAHLTHSEFDLLVKDPLLMECTFRSSPERFSDAQFASLLTNSAQTYLSMKAWQSPRCKSIDSSILVDAAKRLIFSLRRLELGNVFCEKNNNLVSVVVWRLTQFNLHDPDFLKENLLYKDFARLLKPRLMHIKLTSECAILFISHFKAHPSLFINASFDFSKVEDLLNAICDTPTPEQAQEIKDFLLEVSPKTTSLLRPYQIQWEKRWLLEDFPDVDSNQKSRRAAL